MSVFLKAVNVMNISLFVFLPILPNQQKETHSGHPRKQTVGLFVIDNAANKVVQVDLYCTT